MRVSIRARGRWFGVLCCYLCSSWVHSAEPEPRIALVLAGDGAAAFYNVGVMKALEEARIQPSIVVATGLSSYIGALYATGHSAQQIDATCRRIAALLADSSADSDPEGYLEDAGIYRELATHLLPFDTAFFGRMQGLPVHLSLIGQDIDTRQRVVLSAGRLLPAVRATLSSALTVAPVDYDGMRFMSFNFPSVDAAREAGADLIIAVGTDALSLKREELESRVADLLQLAQPLDMATNQLQTLTASDIVVGRSSIASDAFEDYELHVTEGYRDALARIVTNRLPPAKPISFERIRKPPPGGILIGSVEVNGARFIPTKIALANFGLKKGDKFTADSILGAIDRALATRYYRTVHFDFKNVAPFRLGVSFDVQEAEVALPDEALPKLEQALLNASVDPALAIRAAASVGKMRPAARSLVPALCSALGAPSTKVRRAALQALGSLQELSISAFKAMQSVAAETDAMALRADAFRAMSMISLAASFEGMTEALPSIVDARNSAVNLQAGTEAIMTFNLAIERLESLAAVAATRQSAITLDDASLLAGKTRVTLNGVDTPVQVDAKDNTVKFLSEKTDLRQGLNVIDSTRFWLEERKLQAYESPYKNSYAIVVAISDYARAADPQKRGRTGFDEVPQMVPEAKKLVTTLQRVGFPAKNILTLFDQNATSDRLEATLQRFWQGGDLANADRLFVYFGGHGSVVDSTPILITYDYDPKRPTTTSFQMQDFVERQSRNLRPHHVLFALDACHAGLTAKHLGDTNAEKAQFLRFSTLAAIRRDTEPRARNLLVAGTGDQLALYKNGGLFTRALVESLGGGGDLNKDGVIQMEELAFSVRNWVTEHAGREMERQDPDYKILDTYGAGRFMFLMR